MSIQEEKDEILNKQQILRDEQIDKETKKIDQIKKQEEESRSERLSLIPGILDEALVANAVILANGNPVTIRIPARDCCHDDVADVIKMLDEAGFTATAWKGYDELQHCFEVKIKPEED